jgi:hypothetical protein
MSGLLFNFKPAELRHRAQQEREQQALALERVAQALRRRDLSVEDLTAIIDTEMPPIRTGMALARNYQQEAEMQEAKLAPVLELWDRRVEGSAAA